MKDTAVRVFLVSAAFSTACSLALFLVGTRLATFSSLPHEVIAYVLIAAAALNMLVGGLFSRRIEGSTPQLTAVGVVPAGAVVMGLAMALSAYTGQAGLLFLGFLFGVAVAVYALLKNLDEVISPKLLMFVPMVQIMLIHFVIA